MKEPIAVMSKDDKDALKQLQSLVNRGMEILEKIKTEKNIYAISRAVDGLQDLSIWGSAAYHKKG